MSQVIDFHTHIFPTWIRDDRQRYAERDATFGAMYADPKSKMATADDLISAMNEDGVHMSVVIGVGCADEGMTRDLNDYIIESVAKYPTRLMGFGGVNPRWGSSSVVEVRRCYEAGLVGIGELHPDTQRFDLSDKKTMEPIMGTAREENLIVSTHSSEPVGHLYPGKGTVTPNILWQLVQNFPDNILVLAHWGGGLPFYALMPEVKKTLGNVYFDTAASSFLYNEKVFQIMPSIMGWDRVLLGSDYPLLRAGRLLKEIDVSTASDSDKKAVRGNNAAYLLGIS